MNAPTGETLGARAASAIVDPPPPEPTCPYPGLTALTIGDAEYFAGRETQIATKRERFAGRQFLSVSCWFLVGASGAGKSSLLQAGFAARNRDDVDVLLVTLTAAPADHLAAWMRNRAVESKPYLLAVDQLEQIFVAPFDDAAAGAYLTKLDELCTPAIGSSLRPPTSDWDVPDGDPAGRFVAEQNGPINTLSINAEGTLLAAAGDDRVIGCCVSMTDR